MEESKLDSEAPQEWMTIEERDLIVYANHFETGGEHRLHIYGENIPGEDEEAESREVGTALATQVVRDWCEANDMEYIGVVDHEVTPWGCTIQVQPVVAEDES